MRVKIIKVSNEDCWYKDMIGQVIEAMAFVENCYVVSMYLYIFAEDVELTTEPITAVSDTWGRGIA